jgi:surface polysaccharide O-acyltransferase-like enzyme
MILSNLVFLRILAIALIVNSHLEVLYPTSKLAFGGHLGNSLFYFVSGFGLSESFHLNPLPVWEWAKKRAVKVIVPLLLFIALVNLGDWQTFKALLFKYLIWHDKKQLVQFLPVLWALYILFIPINKLSSKKLLIVTTFLAVLSFFLFVYRVMSLDKIPPDLPSNDIFFPLNAFICFMLGIYFNKAEMIALKKYPDLSILVSSLSILLVTQLTHQLIMRYGGPLVLVNFYLNFISIIAIYTFITTIKIGILSNMMHTLRDISTASLAVYIIHPKVITVIHHSDMSFPYSIIGVYLYSFMLSISITRLASNLSASILKKISKEP